VFILVENIQLIDGPMLQEDEPKIDCMGLIMSTLKIMFRFLWKWRITRYSWHLISAGSGHQQVKHS